MNQQKKDVEKDVEDAKNYLEQIKKELEAFQKNKYLKWKLKIAKRKAICEIYPFILIIYLLLYTGLPLLLILLSLNNPANYYLFINSMTSLVFSPAIALFVAFPINCFIIDEKLLLKTEIYHSINQLLAEIEQITNQFPNLKNIKNLDQAKNNLDIAQRLYELALAKLPQPINAEKKPKEKKFKLRASSSPILSGTRIKSRMFNK